MDGVSSVWTLAARSPAGDADVCRTGPTNDPSRRPAANPSSRTGKRNARLRRALRLSPRQVAQTFAEVALIGQDVQQRAFRPELYPADRADRAGQSIPEPPDTHAEQAAQQNADRGFVRDDQDVSRVEAMLNL